MKKEKNIKKVIEVSTLIFLFLMPFFSLIFFHNHLTTLLEVIIVFILCFFTVIFYPESRKSFKWLLLYYILCVLFLLISYFRSSAFTSLVPGNFGYNIVSEALTILKLITPITLLYSLYYQKMPKEKYIKVVKLWIILIAGSIIITNIFKISLSSYNEDFITKNIFEWNTNNYYQEIASRGFFTYPNQIAIILILLLLVTLKEFLFSKTSNIFYILILTISMVMLGTRVATIGGLLVLIGACLFYYIYIFFKKEKLNKKSFYLLIPLCIWCLLIPISPYKSRNNELAMAAEAEKDNITSKDEEKEDLILTDEKIKFVYDNYNSEYLPNVFFEEYYPIQYDSDFWCNYINNTPLTTMNYRHTEKSIIKRVFEVNDDKLDVFFGISNTRIQNIMNIERDFLLHYYAFGLIGALILLFIYIILLGISIYLFLKDKDYDAFILVSCIVLFIASAYLTGNIINTLNATLPFVFIVSGYIDYRNKG